MKNILRFSAESFNYSQCNTNETFLYEENIHLSRLFLARNNQRIAKQLAEIMQLAISIM